MARRRRKGSAPPKRAAAATPSAGAPTVTAPTVAATAAAAPSSEAAGVAAAPVGDGTPRPGAWLHLAGGALLLSFGAAVQLYPVFHTAEGFRALVERFPYAPVLGVLIAAAGMAVSVYGAGLAAGEPRRWALVHTGKTWLGEKLAELNVVSVLRELDREAAAERAARAARGETAYDWRPIVAFVSGAVFLALMEYYGHKPHLSQLLGDIHPAHAGAPDHWVDELRASAFYSRGRETGLVGFAWWSGWRVFGFFLLPAAVIKLVLRERVVDYGLQTRGFLEHAWLYSIAFIVVLVLVVVVAHEESFRNYYPFYDQAARSWYDFWTWELLYAAQFFSLEFFFRGFWLNAARRSMGSHAIYAMMVPYVMIHFGKPLPETFGAIFAGLALGALALRTRSIWSGFLIHVAVALSMDLTVLIQTRGLPERWWPEL